MVVKLKRILKTIFFFFEKNIVLWWKNTKKNFVGKDSWFKRSYLIFDERNDLCHNIFWTYNGPLITVRTLHFIILTYNTEDTRSMVGHVVRNGNTVIIRWQLRQLIQINFYNQTCQCRVSTILARVSDIFVTSRYKRKPVDSISLFYSINLNIVKNKWAATLFPTSTPKGPQRNVLVNWKY